MKGHTPHHLTFERPDLGSRLSRQEHPIHPREIWNSLAQGRADLARLAGHPLRFPFHYYWIPSDPCRGPVFDLDDPDARWADDNDVNLVGLKAMGCGECQVRKQQPLALARFGNKARLELTNGPALTLVDRRSAANDTDSHAGIPNRAVVSRSAGDLNLG